MTCVTEHLFDPEATSEVLSISLLYLRAVLVQVLACTRALARPGACATVPFFMKHGQPRRFPAAAGAISGKKKSPTEAGEFSQITCFQLPSKTSVAPA